MTKQKNNKKKYTSLDIRMPKRVPIDFIPAYDFNTYDRYHWVATISLSLGSTFATFKTKIAIIAATIFFGAALWSIVRIIFLQKQMRKNGFTKSLKLRY